MIANDRIANDRVAADRADALFDEAAAHVQRGDLDAAAASFEASAASEDRSPGRARALQLAAFMHATRGDHRASRALATQAMEALPDDLPTSVASLAQRAEADLAEGRLREAAALFGEASTRARSGGLAADVSIALARRLGACQIALGAFDLADATYELACSLADARIAAYLHVEHARLLLDAQQPVLAAVPLATAESLDRGEMRDDVQWRAEMLVERARLRRVDGRVGEAGRDADEARRCSLEALAPVSYLAASVQRAEIDDARGERAAAYGSLAAAWVTLADLLGRDIARTWVEPCLLALRLRWGEAAFASARGAYEARRRCAGAEGHA